LKDNNVLSTVNCKEFLLFIEQHRVGGAEFIRLQLLEKHVKVDASTTSSVAATE